MHLFNAGRLASELRENALSETEKYRYFIILLVLRTINEALHAVAGQARNDRINFVVMTIVSLIGYHICHIINQRGDGQKLIERLICLSVPVSIWVYLLSFGGYYAGFLRSRCNTGTLDLISWWYFVPQRETTHFIALPEVPRYDLARAATQSKPNPNLVLVSNLTPSAQRAPASNSNTSST